MRKAAIVLVLGLSVWTSVAAQTPEKPGKQREKEPCIVGISLTMKHSELLSESSTTERRDADNRSLPPIPSDEAFDMYHLEEDVLKKLFSSLDEIAERENLHLFFAEYESDKKRTAHVWVDVRVWWDANSTNVYRDVYYSFRGQQFETFSSSTSLLDFVGKLWSLDIPQTVKEQAGDTSLKSNGPIEFAKQLESMNLPSTTRTALLRARFGSFPTVEDVLKAVRRWRLAHGAE